MSWQITVILDLDQADVGTCSAVWTDPIVALGVFSYSVRVKANVASVDAFIAEAIARRNAWQLKQQDNINKAAYVLGKINAADPKAV